MKTIGLIGGMSWHSTLEYYRVINELVAERRGGHASAADHACSPSTSPRSGTASSAATGPVPAGCSPRPVSAASSPAPTSC